MEDDSTMREYIYTTIIMERETDERWQSFLISCTHGKLLLMSDKEKRSFFIENILNTTTFSSVQWCFVEYIYEKKKCK